MAALGDVTIGAKAPHFKCEAVVSGRMTEICLADYMNADQWLILLFIPAAFSFVCPTEVLAFQNCLDEFNDRNCAIAFVSVDTKHSLWHWQNVPRQYGGLGMVDVPLLSDANHRMGRAYGVLIEDKGVCLRGMFIIDNEQIVQQITLNNHTVGRSVLEALRLLEAFQAVAKHGILCPIDWRPSDEAQDTLNTISNTLVESYEDRLANLRAEFSGVTVKDLDARPQPAQVVPEASQATLVKTNKEVKTFPPDISDSSQIHNADIIEPPRNNVHRQSLSGLPNHGHDSPKSQTSSPPLSRRSSPTLSRNASSNSIVRRQSLSYQHSMNVITPEWTSQRGSQVTLTFAEPTVGSPPPVSMRPNTPIPSQQSPPHPLLSPRLNHPLLSPQLQMAGFFGDDMRTPVPYTRSRSTASGTDQSPMAAMVAAASASNLTGYQSNHESGAAHRNGAVRAGSFSSKVNGVGSPGAQSPGGQTRLQATFEAIRKMSSGLTSPSAKAEGQGHGKGAVEARSAKGGERMPAYFDVVPEGVET